MRTSLSSVIQAIASMAFVPLGLFIALAEPVGIIHAFWKHGTTGGLAAIFLPPLAWWRAIEVFFHSSSSAAVVDERALEVAGYFLVMTIGTVLLIGISNLVTRAPGWARTLLGSIMSVASAYAASVVVAMVIYVLVGRINPRSSAIIPCLTWGWGGAAFFLAANTTCVSPRPTFWAFAVVAILGILYAPDWPSGFAAVPLVGVAWMLRPWRPAIKSD